MTALDVAEAIAAKLAGLWPDRMIYRDFCPEDFQRPSSFLYVTQDGMTDLSIGLVQWDAELQLELFCSTDHYDASSTEALRREQARVLEAFSGPGLAVGERHITLEARGDGAEAGRAFVQFSASWIDARPRYRDPEAPGGGTEDPGGPPQKMEQYTLNVSNRKD